MPYVYSSLGCLCTWLDELNLDWCSVQLSSHDIFSLHSNNVILPIVRSARLRITLYYSDMILVNVLGIMTSNLQVAKQWEFNIYDIHKYGDPRIRRFGLDILKCHSTKINLNYHTIKYTHQI